MMYEHNANTTKINKTNPITNPVSWPGQSSSGGGNVVGTGASIRI